MLATPYAIIIAAGLLGYIISIPLHEIARAIKNKNENHETKDKQN